MRELSVSNYEGLFLSNGGPNLLIGEDKITITFMVGEGNERTLFAVDLKCA